jgi:ABC-type polysaccharide/polyol phosphate export permease
MAGVITSYRSIVLDGALPPAGVFGIAAAASLLFLAAGVVTFRRYEKVFADLI